MMTIEQLRAMPKNDRAAYLGQINDAMKRDETMDQQARNDQRRWEARMAARGQGHGGR